jgi:predicted  nucleic acid-binding Zn-ribbon protein
MSYDPDMLRQMNEEAQLRIAELSNALQDAAVARDNFKDAAESLMIELDAYKRKVRELEATVSRLRLHIQQGVEL